MAANTNSKTVLVIEARYYDQIANNMVIGATPVVEAAGLSIERMSVPGTFEIPAACEMAIRAGQRDPHQKYAGILALGCVIRGQTDHYDHICRETSHAIMDMTVNHRYPIGFGVLTCENMTQATERADPNQKNKGAEAATAVVRMIEIRRHFQGRADD